MLLHIILLTLGIQVIFSENPQIECNTEYKVMGCYKGSEIVIGYKNPNQVLYHELGHALFLKDQEVKDVISKYPAPRYYPDYAYPTANQKLDEKVADYFEMYMRYSDFPDKFPEVNELFNNKLKPYKNKIKQYEITGKFN